MSSFSTIAAVVTVAMVAAAVIGVVEAQTECVSNLVPCAQYLNTTTTGPECCSAIRQVVNTQLPCLCRLYENPGVLPGFNFTQALLLPRRCGISTDVTACNAALAPGSPKPPAVPGGHGGNSGSRSMSWMGMPALILISVITFFY